MTPILASGGVGPTFPLLTAMVVLPVVGALAIAITPKRRTELHKLIALLFSGGTGAFTLWILGAFETGVAGYQFETKTTWIQEFGIGWHLGIDGISLFLVVLTGILFPIALIAVNPHHDPKPYYAWMLILEAGCLGVFVALDLFVFFIFFEIVLVPMYFLIGGWGYGERVYAALKFFLYTMFGSAMMLVGIISLAFVNVNETADLARPVLASELGGEFGDLIEGNLAAGEGEPDPELVAEFQERGLAILERPSLTFDLTEIAGNRAAVLRAQQAGLQLPDIDETGAQAVDQFGQPVTVDYQVDPDWNSWNPLDWGLAKWVFLAFAMAFAVKVPLFPLHTWLPDAHTQAPTAGSVILAGVMLKLGTYGFIRFGLYLFPDATTFFAPVFVTLGVIGILYGAIVATMQKDLKRLVAYSSVAHLGFIALGTFALTTQSIEGSILQMVNHGVSTGALFLLVGMIYDRRHTREIAALKGLQKSAPILAAVFTLVMLSSIGLPGLNGFAGEFLILAGSYLTRKWFTVVAAGGVILAALYLLWAYQRVFHGEPTEEDLQTKDMGFGEFAVMAPLLGLIVFMGVYPKPVIDRMEPSVTRLVEHIEAATDYVEPASATSGFSGTIVASHEGEDDHGADDDHGSEDDHSSDDDAHDEGGE